MGRFGTRVKSFAFLRMVAHSMSDSTRSRLGRRVLSLLCRENRTVSEVACAAAVQAVREQEGTGTQVPMRAVGLLAGSYRRLKWCAKRAKRVAKAIAKGDVDEDDAEAMDKAYLEMGGDLSAVKDALVDSLTEWRRETVLLGLFEEVKRGQMYYRWTEAVLRGIGRLCVRSTEVLRWCRGSSAVASHARQWLAWCDSHTVSTRLPRGHELMRPLDGKDLAIHGSIAVEGCCTDMTQYVQPSVGAAGAGRGGAVGGSGARHGGSGASTPSFQLATAYKAELEVCRKAWRAVSGKVDRTSVRLMLQSMEGREGQPLLHEEEMDLIGSDDELEEVVGVPVLLPASASHHLLHPTSPLRSVRPSERFEVKGLDDAKEGRAGEGPTHSLQQFGRKQARSVQLLYTRLRLVVKSSKGK